MLSKTLRKVATITLKYLASIRKRKHWNSIKLIEPKGISDVMCPWKKISNGFWVNFLKIKVATMCLCGWPGSTSGFCCILRWLFFFWSWFWTNALSLEAPFSSRGVNLVKATHCFLFANLSSCCLSEATTLWGRGRLQSVSYNYISDFLASCYQSASHKNTCFFKQQRMLYLLRKEGVIDVSF